MEVRSLSISSAESMAAISCAHVQTGGILHDKEFGLMASVLGNLCLVWKYPRFGGDLTHHSGGAGEHHSLLCLCVGNKEPVHCSSSPPLQAVGVGI